MCGRYVLAGDPAVYADYFRVDRMVGESYSPRWNVAPTDPVLAVAEHQGERMLGTFRWGLLPHWAKDGKGPLNINARVETVSTTPAFRDSFRRKRCLVPADGFYEWEPRDRGHHPHWFFRADGYPMAFAGLWATWKDTSTHEWVRSCAIVTAPAEGVVRDIHDRMPLILDTSAWEAWLDRDLTDPRAVGDLLTPVDPDLLMEHTVSSRVNNVRNDGPELITPVST